MTTTTDPYIDPDDGIYTEREDANETITSSPEPKRTTVTFIKPNQKKLIDFIKPNRAKVSTTTSSVLYTQQNTTEFEQEDTTTPGQKHPMELEYIYPVTTRREMQDNDDDDLNTTTEQEEVTTEFPPYLINYTISTKEPLDDIIPLSDDLPPVFDTNATIIASKNLTRGMQANISTTTLPQINTTTLAVRIRNTSSPPPIAKTRMNVTTKTIVVNDTVILDALNNAFSPTLPKLEALGPDIICSGTQGCFKGKCVNNKCLCDDFWVGDRCNVRACAGTCPKGTRCQDGKCQVDHLHNSELLDCCLVWFLISFLFLI